jgi:hypothetical protein
MSRILFDVARPIVESDPARADVACFVGLARATGSQLPQAVQDWLQARGWTDGITSTLASAVGPGDNQIRLTAPLAAGAVAAVFIDQERLNVLAIDSKGTLLSVDRGAQSSTAAAHGAGAIVQAILSPTSRPIGPPFTDIPIPIESYPAFTALFDPGGSPQSYGTDYLAVAVRSFFAQGGRRCYVVSMDAPVSQSDTLTDKRNKLAKLLPDSLFAPDDRRSWHGVGHLGGLPDVSYLAVPDLSVLAASLEPPQPPRVFPQPTGAVVFSECAPATVPPAAAPAQPATAPAPRLTPGDYTLWASNLNSIVATIQQNFREVQLVAAFPMPRDLNAAAALTNLASHTLAQDVHDVIDSAMPEIPGGGLSTAFLQLGYPWLKTSGSGVLSESLEPPDGMLTGILARNALTRGAFMDATKIVPSELFDVSPLLPTEETQVPSTPLVWNGISSKPLITRLSLFGFTPLGLRLLSDVTAYPGESYRPARIHRLIAVLSRAARRLGEQVVFRQNGPGLWLRIERALQQLLTRFWRLNALDGDTIDQAFTVRCDSSTMTQNDLDSGRLIALVTFQAASTIELIRVTLAMETSGTTSSQNLTLLAEANQ